MLKEIQLSIDALLLDPNNPRFISNLDQPVKVPFDKLEKMQDGTLKRFSRNAEADDPDFDVTNIKDLYDSMLSIGFVVIDRIVVRSIPNSDKYLVLEGNRRIATVKCILRDYEKQIPPLDKPSKDSPRKKAEQHLDSLKTITAIQLNTEGFSEDEIDRKVAILLGIRHHGSLLEWGLLPKAFNIYTEYMAEDVGQDTFRWDHKKAAAVANRLCIKTPDVEAALRTYQAYIQVCERFAIKDDHYSLLNVGVLDKHLRGSYFEIDPDTFLLDEKSLTKLNNVCQFETRDSKQPELTTNGKKKILPDPQRFKTLGRLISRMVNAKHPAIKSYALDLIQRVENEDDLEMTVDQAKDDLTAFENRTKWAEAISKLIEKQEKDLSLDKYLGEGLDRARKDELNATLSPLRRIMGI